MTVNYDPNQEKFDDKDCGAALLAAVTQLAIDRNLTVADFCGRPLTEITAMATDTYGGELPEFWQAWCSWHTSGPTPEMGDL
jgi:hypothetical protein